MSHETVKDYLNINHKGASKSQCRYWNSLPNLGHQCGTQPSVQQMKGQRYFVVTGAGVDEAVTTAHTRRGCHKGRRCPCICAATRTCPAKVPGWGESPFSLQGFHLWWLPCSHHPLSFPSVCHLDCSVPGCLLFPCGQSSALLSFWEQQKVLSILPLQYLTT